MLAHQVANLVNLNVDSLSKDEAMARFYQEVSSPVQGVCYSLKRMGGKWRPGNKVAEINLEINGSEKQENVCITQISRHLMEINLFAWTPTRQETALSILLVSGLYVIVLLGWD